MLAIKSSGIILVILLVLSFVAGCTGILKTTTICAEKEGGCGDGSLPSDENEEQSGKLNEGDLQPPPLPEEQLP